MKKSVRFLAFAVLAGSIFAVTGCTDPHSHAYDTQWSADETNHWHAATCGHDLKQDEGAHEGMEADGTCDVCGYHVHMFDDSTWAFDETNHWHADTCGHDQKKDVEAHTTNKLGVCLICEQKVAEPDLTSVEKAVEIGAMQGGLVTSGTVVKTTDYKDNSSLRDHTVEGVFEIAEDYLYFSEEYTITSTTKNEFWFAVVNGVTVAFEKENGDSLSWKKEDFEQEAVNGYFFDGNEIGNLGGKSYGVENYLNILYQVGDTKAMDNTFVENVNEDVYSFSYDLQLTDSSDDILGVSVAFELDEETYTVKSMTIDVSRWYYPVDTNGDHILEKPTDATTGEVVAPDETNTTVITQKTGETIVKAINPEEMLLSSFDIYDGEEKVENEITLVCGVDTRFDVKNMLPESATDFTYDKITLTGINADTGEEVGVDYWGDYTGTFVKSDRQIKFQFKVLGTYEVTIYTRTISKTITVNVVRPETTELNVQVNGAVATTASVYVGDALSFSTAANQYADASATAVFTSKPEGSQLSDYDIVVNQSTGAFMFEPDVAGTYEITLTSVANPELEATLTVTAEERPTIGNALNGTYTAKCGNMYGTVTAKFVPDATPVSGSEYSGKLTMTAEGGMFGAMSFEHTYTYSESTGFVCEQSGLFVVLDGMNVVAHYNAGYGDNNLGTLTKVPGSEVEPEQPDEPQQPEIVSPWAGSGTEADPYVITNFETDFTVVYTGENGVLSAVVYTFTSDKSGTLTLTFDTADTWVFLDPGYNEYSEEDSYDLTIQANQTYTLKILSYSETAKNIAVSMSFEEGEVGGGDEGGEDETPVWLEDGENTITVTADDITAEVITYLYMPWESGTYTFANDDGIVAIVYYNGMEIGRNQVYLDTSEIYTIKLLVVAVEAGEYTLTISMEAEEGGDEVETWGSITVETTDTYGWFDLYTFTAPADGNYEFSLPEGLGFYSKVEHDEHGAPELNFYDNTYGDTVTVYLSANEEYQFYVGATTKGEWVIYWNIADDSAGGEEIQTPWVDVGDNTITVTDTDISFESMLVMFMPSETAVYTFTSADGILVRIYDADMNMIQPGTTLNALETYEVYLNVAGLEAGEYVLTVAMVVEGGDDEGGDVSVPDGTKNNPYVITELPYEHKVTGAHDFYITYTATESFTLKISYMSGCYVSDLPEGWVKDAENFFYTIAVTEGQVLKLNLWKMSGSDEYTYKFEKVVVVEPETPDVGGDEGGEENADVFTYIGEGGGRKMRVVVNKAENTIVVTRADSNNNFENGTTYNYTYTVENGEVVTTLVESFSNITSMTFNAEDISPVSIVYFGASYTGWVLQ